MDLPASLESLLNRDAIAVLSTVLPDDTPHAVPVWMDFDGDHLLTAGPTDMRRHKNVRANPAVAVAVIDPANIYHSYMIKGMVDGIADSGALDFLDEQAEIYLGIDEFPYDRERNRILLRIGPRAVVDSGSSRASEYLRTDE